MRKEGDLLTGKEQQATPHGLILDATQKNGAISPNSVLTDHKLQLHEPST